MSRWSRCCQGCLCGLSILDIPAKKNEGKRTHVEKTPLAQPSYRKKNFDVVLRGIDIKTGMYKGEWRECEGYVRDGNAIMWCHAVFQGFHTEDEAKEHWKGAGREQP